MQMKKTELGKWRQNRNPGLGPQTGIFALPELSQSMTLNLMVSWGKKEPLCRGGITLFQK